MKKNKKPFELTTDKALLFSAILLIIFTAVMVVSFFIFQSVPDSLVVAFFGAFGLEGGYCAFIHKVKKEHNAKIMENLNNLIEKGEDENETEEII